ncbi:phage tail tape measure protein [Kingella denitrificans]|uniref:phage tail tape measure protein n=1 Tax=Kingella denitrificans TaxID=502 RepID=UPI00288B6D3E|nr:phage tail tape measure protein [Kingella denitrificans]
MSAELSIAIKVGATVGGATAVLRTLLGNTRDLRNATQLLRREYRSLGQAVKQAEASGSADLQRLRRNQAALWESTRRLRHLSMRQSAIQTRLELERGSREKMRSEVMGVIASVGTVIMPIKVAMDFETSMAEVRKVVDFDTPQQFKQMGDDLLQMTHRIPMAGRELAQIAASGGQLGIARKDIAGFTETVAKMSVAFDMAADQAGDSMAKLANVYKIPIAQIGRLGDAINHLSNSSPAKASDLVNTLGRVGGVAKQFGLTELQTASLANAFISLGKTPEIAGTAINGMLTKLSTADRQGKKFQTALKAIGTSAQELKANIAKNGEQALVDFLKQLNKLPKADQMGALVDLFGLEYADDVAVLAGNIEAYEKSIRALKETGSDGKPLFAGSMDKEFAARSATTANNVQLLKNQLMHLAISIGSVMLPAVNSLVAGLKPWVDYFIRLSEAHPELVQNVYKLIAALVGFKAGSLIVRYLFSFLTTSALQLGSVFLGLRGAIWRVVAAFRLFQIGRAVTALRMFGLSARHARVLISMLSGSLRFIGTAFGWVVNAGRMLVSFLPMVGKAFMALGRFLLTTPLGIALTLMATAAYMLYARWDGVVGGAKLLWQDLCSVVSTVASAVANFFANMWATVQSLFSSAISAILSLIRSFNPVSAFQAAFAAVSGFFSGLAGRFAAFGSMIIDGLVNGIRAKIGAAVAAVQGLGARIKSAFTGAKSMDIHSPSRVFKRYGGFIAEGLAIGVNGGAARPVGRIAQLAGSMKQRFAERMGGLRSQVSARLAAHAGSLQQARQEAAAAQGGGAITVHFNPTINAPGGNPAQIETALQTGLREFEQLFERLMADRARRAY